MKRFVYLASMVSLFLSISIAKAASLEFVPSLHNTTVGNTVNIAVRISGLGNQVAPSLGVFDINVVYDSSILSLSSAIYGDPILGDQLDINGIGSIKTTTPTTGSINLFELSLDPASVLDSQQAGEFILANLSFNTLAIGNSSLTFNVNSLGDSAGNPISTSLSSGAIHVAAAIPGINTIPTLSYWGIVIMIMMLAASMAIYTTRLGGP